MKRFFILCGAMCVVFVCSLSDARAQVPDKKSKQGHEILLDFFDKNELVNTYYRYCVNNTAMPPARFVDHAALVSATLQRALVGVYPNKSQEEIESGLLKRSTMLQRINTDRWVKNQNCQSQWARTADRHFRLMIDMDDETLRRFINKQMNIKR